MRTKLRIQSLDEWELDGMEFECTLPIIKNKTIIFGAYNMNFEITDNIWYQSIKGNCIIIIVKSL